MGSIDTGFSPHTDTSPGLDYDYDEFSPLRAIYDNDPPPTTEESYDEKDLALRIKKVLSTLSERERAVITMRYGLEDGKPKTLNEIGIVLGVTQERIRQLESKAMSKLQQPARLQPLRGFIDD
jgi:RNA polymerase primary sigma factor